MSFYSMIHGENPFSNVLLAILGLNRSQIPRYRDCFWDGTHIGVYTRTGGNNRDDYEEENAMLEDHPNHVRNEDDDFDDTYATFYFSIPEKLQWTIPHLTATEETPEQKWTSFIDRMNSSDGKDDPQVAKAISAFAPIFEKIAAALNAEPKND